jgi:hypothetical protein
MKTKTILAVPILILLLIAAVVSAQAQSPTPQQTLDQARIAEEQREAQSDNVNPEGSCPKVVVTVPRAGFTRSLESMSSLAEEKLKHCVADLQKAPGDTALRERIIALALTMSPPPEVPADARRHMSRGVAAVEDAKTPEDFKDACNEFLQATTIAPWLGNAYRNLAIAQDKAGMYNESLASLRLYLLTQPSAADADWAEDLKSKVEYRRDKAAKASQEANRSQQQEQEAAARRTPQFEGEWCQTTDSDYNTCVPYQTRPMPVGRMRPLISRNGSLYSVKFIDLAGQGDVTCTDVQVNGNNIKFIYSWGASVRYELTITNDGRQLHGTAGAYSQGQWLSAPVHFVRVR